MHCLSALVFGKKGGGVPTAATATVVLCLYDYGMETVQKAANCYFLVGNAIREQQYSITSQAG